jgi:uncharacterized protein (DUF1778 family)
LFHHLKSTDNGRTIKNKSIKTMSNVESSQPKKEKRFKEERLEARLTASQKELLQQAATLEGTSLTEFVVRSAQQQARRVIEEHTQIKLGLEDSQAFVESLLNPPNPNSRMMAAADEYKRSLGN